MEKLVELTDLEVWHCKLIAASWRENAQACGARNMLGGDSSKAHQYEHEGVCGELAYCKLFNLYPRIWDGLAAAESGNDPGDIVHDGYRIDVKTTSFEEGRLLVEPHKRHSPVDFYALMVGTGKVFRLAGYAPVEDVFRPEHIVSIRGRDIFGVDQWELEARL